MDLDAYLDRIAYAGPTSVSRTTLDALCLAHVRAIPFENLDVLRGRGIDLADEAVEAKLVGARRGGYCFEHNTLMARVLARLGFTAELVSARVRLQRPRHEIPPRTHVFNVVTLAGERLIVDVGVGGLSPTAALALDTDGAQATPHEPRRLVREGALWFHQALLPEGWVDVWESTLEPMPAIDREVANWFTSAHPRSHFRNRLLAARALPDGGRVTLLNQELTVRRADGVTRTVLEDPAALLGALDAHFGLRFPAGTRFEGPPFTWAAAAPPG